MVKTIGIGIGKVALTLSKHELGLELGDDNLIIAAHQDLDNLICSGRQLYELAKQTWQDKSKLERYELVGNYAIDLLLLKGIPTYLKYNFPYIKLLHIYLNSKNIALCWLDLKKFSYNFCKKANLF